MKLLSDIEHLPDGQIAIEWEETDMGRYWEILSEENGTKKLNEYQDWCNENENIINEYSMKDRIDLIRQSRKYAKECCFELTDWELKCSEWLQIYEDNNTLPKWEDWVKFLNKYT